MDKIMIKDLLVRGVIGVNDWERDILQDILINIEMFGDFNNALKSDDIEDCINYRTVSKGVIELVSNQSRFTVEALAGDIMEMCLEQKNVQKAIVRVEKPGAIRFSRSVGVEIERSN